MLYVRLFAGFCRLFSSNGETTAQWQQTLAATCIIPFMSLKPFKQVTRVDSVQSAILTCMQVAGAVLTKRYGTVSGIGSVHGNQTDAGSLN